MSAENVADLSQFFNRLVEMIPARFYRDEEDRIDMYSMKKADRLAAKQQLKAKAKLNKLAKLSRTENTTAADDVAEAEEAPSTSGKGDAVLVESSTGAKHAASLLNIPTGNMSRDELQEKLQQRILVRIHAPLAWARPLTCMWMLSSAHAPG